MIALYWKDLMLKSRIKEHALARGIDLKFAKTFEELATFLKDNKVKRLIVDLSSGAEFASSFAPILQANLESFGVIAHVDTATQQAALQAGFSKVIPRSVLVRDLAELID